MSACLFCIFLALALLSAANGAPILVRKLLHHRYATPIDHRTQFRDGYPLFGKAKTWRGLVASVGLTTAAASLLNLSPLLGTKFALLAMAGDLIASFCKRRMGKIESSRARGLDTLPESLLPLWVLQNQLSLSHIDILLAIVIFFLLEEFGSPLLYKWHIRRRPY